MGEDGGEVGRRVGRMCERCFFAGEASKAMRFE